MRRSFPVFAVLALSLIILHFTIFKTQAAPPPIPSPSAATWYFAEGRVGAGFRQYLTVENPNPSGLCTVQATYLYILDGSSINSTKIVSFTVSAQSRATESVNQDLLLPDSSPQAATLSAIVKSSGEGCAGIVVERPMQFTNFHGLSSGTNIIGATDAQLGQNFSFADIATGAAGETFLSVLNPGDTSVTVHVSYYAHNSTVAQEILSINPRSRGTFQPNNLNMAYPHVAASLSSDKNILVERASYFTNINGVSGAADVLGVPGSSNHWTFAEGLTTADSQENLLLANFDPINTATVTVTLHSTGGVAGVTTFQVGPLSEGIWNVNAYNTYTNATSEVSADVVSIGAPLVVQRQMFQRYHGANTDPSHSTTNWQAQAITDTPGNIAPKIVYGFAEGYSAQFYNEWLLLYNPTGLSEDITVTLVNTFGTSYPKVITVGAYSRASVNITPLVEQNLIPPGNPAEAYATSLTVSATGLFAAERSMYFHPITYPVQGANTLAGYA